MRFPPFFLTAAAALLLVAPVYAQQGEANAPVSRQGGGPYYRLTLPAALYGRAAYTDLRDLRIRNASGNAVPYGWLHEEREAPHTASQKVPIFAAPASAGAAPSDALLSFQLRSDGSLLLVKPVAPVAGATPWLIDVSQVRGNLLQARLEVAAGTQGVFGYRLEASDDLRNWRPIGSEEQLVKLSHNNQNLERLAVDLGGIRTRFLRLSWTDPAQGARLTAVNIDSVLATEAAVPQEWSEAIQPERCAAAHCDYLLPRGLPARSLRIALAETNTLAQLEVLGLPDPAPTAATLPIVQPRHNPLHVLRRQRDATRPAAAPGEVRLADSVVYRLTQGGAEARSPEIALDGAVYPRLRLRTTGPIALLGATPPAIAVATTPRTLVFLAQGQPPFSLAWRTSVEPNAVPTSGAALSLSTLIPGYSSRKPVTADPASVALAVQATVPAAPPAAAAAMETANNPAKRTAWLWVALAVGLLLLAGMAWSLFASMKKST
ncbi:DUF3999 domain-containing protein [Polaromonas sp.]|uniref:DUF3999 domain-containing protein n=1 Tax=Polaromonas sp. TaxID=1869339 RepID=UPI003265789B